MQFLEWEFRETYHLENDAKLGLMSVGTAHRVGIIIILDAVIILDAF